jgi:hypothetical protein
MLRINVYHHKVCPKISFPQRLNNVLGLSVLARVRNYYKDILMGVLQMLLVK